MRLSVEEFRARPKKHITLLGMSGVGKTRLANMLRGENWFHYSVDYRIGTRYLDEPILDNIKQQAMQVPFLRDLLLSDSIYISNNITFNNLKPLSTWLGKLGNPEHGGLALEEFKHRQALHREAELAAIHDVPRFIRRANEIYGYRHFLNDASGSLCELDDESVLQDLAASTLLIYIRADKQDEEQLIARAATNPKPLYYREAFLEEHLALYMRQNQIEYVSLINPDEFVRWVFPYLFASRVPRYEAIAERYGYSILARDAFGANTEIDFLTLLERSIAVGA